MSIEVCYCSGTVPQQSTQPHLTMSETPKNDSKLAPQTTGILFTNDGSFMAQWQALQAAQAASASVAPVTSFEDTAPGVSSSSAPSPQPDEGLSFKVGVPISACNVPPGEQEHQPQPESHSRALPIATTRKRPASAAPPVVLKTNKSIVKGLINPGAGKPGKQAKAGEPERLVDKLTLFPAAIEPWLRCCMPGTLELEPSCSFVGQLTTLLHLLHSPTILSSLCWVVAA